MGRKRDTDRLGHVLLKYNAVETARIIGSFKDDTNIKTGLKAIEDMLDVMKTIGSIMSKAESADSFRFSNRDSEEMTVADICKELDIKLPSERAEREEELDELIGDAAQSIAKKLGIDPAKIIVGKINGSEAMLKDIEKAIKKHKGKK